MSTAPTAPTDPASPPARPVVTVRGLGVRAGGRVLLDGVDLRVAAGERVALLGPSGSGKSLLVRALLDVLPPGLERTGEVRTSPGAAWVQQDSALALHPLVSVGTQLLRPARRAGRDRARARHDVAAALRRVGLEPARVLPARPGQLSGGERQRVCLALAVLVGSTLVLADEPTTALDTRSQAAVVRALDAVAGAAVLLVTHDVAVAASLCRRALVLAGGRVVEEGPVEQLLAAPRHAVTRSLVEHAVRHERHERTAAPVPA